MISICINADSRPERNEATKMFSGTSSEDYILEGVQNKINFFGGSDIEVVLFIDEHEPISEKTLEIIRRMVTCLVIRKHTHENNFNDYNYLSALQLCRGDYVAHFDQDTAAFSNSYQNVTYLTSLLENYRFVSYPSYWSPKAIDDPSFGKRTWASTRFFMCKRETLRFDVLRDCIADPEWAYRAFGDSPRRCNWLEHFLSLANEDSVYYPPMDIDKYTIFSWGKYEKYTLRRLNEYSYSQIREWLSQNPIVYPNDIHL